MAYEDTADLSVMPPTGIEGVEERNRRLIREAGGMSTMPPGGGMPPAPVPSAPGSRNYNLSVGATNHPTMPPNVPGPKAEPTAPDLSKMPPATFAPPSATGAAPARPADTGAALGMPPATLPSDVRSSAFSMPPGGLAQQYKEQAAKEPKREDFQATPLPFWKKALGTLGAVAAGTGSHNPELAGRLETELLNSPQAKADKKYNQAEGMWKTALDTINKESGLQNTESEINRRDAETDKIRDAQDKPEHQDIVKEFSDALAKGDQKRIDDLAPRVKQFMETSQKPGKDAAEKSTKEQLQQQIAAADAKGDKAGVKTLQARLKAIDPEGQQRMQITVAAQAAANTRAEKAATRGEVREHDKAYVQPAEGVEKSYQMMDSAYKEYQAAKAAGKELPTGAQSMLALSTHLSTTFGNVKGSRVTKDMIEHHLGARGISDKALVAVQNLTNGDVLSPDQWKAFHDLIGESRKLSWQTAVKQAKRKQVPIDFLPEDLKGMDAPQGASDEVTDANGKLLGHVVNKKFVPLEK